MASPEKEFSERLEEFYSNFVDSYADSLEIMADVQEDFPEKYELMKKIEENPEELIEYTEDLSKEEVQSFLTHMLKLSSLARKASQIYELDPEEKRDLAGEMRKFVEEMKEDISEEED